MKKILLVLFGMVVFGWAQTADSIVLKKTSIQFMGTLNDSSFFGDSLFQAEILETGDVQKIQFNKPFQFSLPIDTLWNICIYGTGKEKCYELVYHGSDYAFSFEITNDVLMTHYDDGNVERVPAVQLIPEDVAEEDIDVNEFLNSDSEQMTELKKVVVQLRRRPKRKLGESVVSAKSIKRMPGLAEADVIRSIQALPGVVASSDFSTKIYVRGGAADQNLFLLDNAVVYSPTHFFGLFSTFLVETIDDVKFYKSGFPAQFGNRLSSVLDIQSRKGGSDTTEAWFEKSSVKISTFAAQLHTEGHKGNARWVIGGRSTYIGPMISLFNTIGLIDFDLDYNFTDLQGALIYQFNEDMELKTSFYLGEDYLIFDPLDAGWGNKAIPLNFRWRFHEWFEYNATASFSHFFQTMEVLDLISLGNDIKTWSLKQWLNYYRVDDHTMTVGYELEYDRVQFWEYILENKILDKQNPFHHVGYLMDAWQLNPDLLLQYGVRLNYQTLSKHFGIEPRLSLAYQIDEDKSVEFYAGRYLQYMNSVMFSDQESLNEFYYPSVTTTKGKHLKPASSYLFAAGYKQRNLWDRFDGSIEAYFKTQNGLNTFKIAQDSTSEDSTSNDFLLADYFGTAEGYSMGYELSLRKEEGPWFGGISWSHSLSVLKSDDSMVYHPNWHQPYAVKLDLGINWKDDKDGIWKYKRAGKFFRSSLVLKYASGMPLTEKIGYYQPYEMDQGDYQDDIVVVSGSRNAGRQTNYFRIDLKLIDIGVENRWNFSWTIINLTNHENMFYYYYDTNKNPPQFEAIYQFPFLPVMLNYEYYF